MLNLKAELLKTKQEFDGLKSKSDNSYVTAKKSASSTSWLKKNRGIEKRNQRDLEYKSENENKEDKVRTILEAKSKMYDKMVSGEMVINEEDSEMFLVDFEQKSVDAWRDKRQTEQSEKDKELEQPETKIKDEWVEYVDTLGRTRTCLQSELHLYQRLDKKLDGQSNPNISSSSKSLMSDDMRREEEREKWEEEVREEMERGPLHYENLRFNEVRELGVGYYTFSGEEEKRKEQMKKLHQLREETEKQKTLNKKKKEKQNSVLQSRLEKVRQKRIKQLQAQGKQVPPQLLEPIQVKEKITENEKSDETVTSSMPEASSSIVEVTSSSSTSQTREWDKGKDDWTPASAPKLPPSWVNPREERPSEFAPPTFYYPPEQIKKRKPKEMSEPLQTKTGFPVNNEPSVNHSDADRIQRVLETLNSIPQTTEVKTEIKSENEDKLEELKPFIPANKPIKITVKQKPSKTLIAKSAFSE